MSVWMMAGMVALGAVIWLLRWPAYMLASIIVNNCYGRLNAMPFVRRDKQGQMIWRDLVYDQDNPGGMIMGPPRWLVYVLAYGMLMPLAYPAVIMLFVLHGLMEMPGRIFRTRSRKQ
jgi:hypothetical protein